MVCVAFDIVESILIMQLMLKMEDLSVAEMVFLPSMQVKEYAPSLVDSH